MSLFCCLSTSRIKRCLAIMVPESETIVNELKKDASLGPALNFHTCHFHLDFYGIGKCPLSNLYL